MVIPAFFDYYDNGKTSQYHIITMFVATRSLAAGHIAKQTQQIALVMVLKQLCLHVMRRETVGNFVI